MLCLRFPQSVEVAVFVGCDDGLGDGEVGLGFVAGFQVFALGAGPGFQDDPFDVVLGEHGVFDRANLNGDVVAVLFDLGDVLFLGDVGGVGFDLSGVGDGGVRGDDLVVEFVEIHCLFFFPCFETEGRSFCLTCMLSCVLMVHLLVCQRNVFVLPLRPEPADGVVVEHAAVGGEEEGHLAVGGGGDVLGLVGFLGAVEGVFDFVVGEDGLESQEDFVDGLDLTQAHGFVRAALGLGFDEQGVAVQDVPQKADVVFGRGALQDHVRHFLVVQFGLALVQFFFPAVQFFFPRFEFPDLHFACFFLSVWGVGWLALVCCLVWWVLLVRFFLCFLFPLPLLFVFLVPLGQEVGTGEAFGGDVFVVVVVDDHHTLEEVGDVLADDHLFVAVLPGFGIVAVGKDQLDIVFVAVGFLPAGDTAREFGDFGEGRAVGLLKLVDGQFVRVEFLRVEQYPLKGRGVPFAAPGVGVFLIHGDWFSSWYCFIVSSVFL